VQIRVGRVDEDGDRPVHDHAVWMTGARLAEDDLLGDRVVHRIELERPLERRQAIGLALLVAVELGQEGAGLDPRRYEVDRAPQVRLRGQEILAVDLGQPQPDLDVVAVAR
jgi:hypothetical protein